MKALMSRLSMAAVLVGATAPAATAQAPLGDIVDSVRTEHVIIISVDGLRPDAIEAFNLGTLQRLMAGGSYALDARTVFPSKTLPSHTSMFTGRTPENHGITFNRANGEEGIVGVPTIFELAKSAGLTTAAFYSKAKLRHLDRPGSYDYRQAPAYNTDNWMATRTVPDAIQYMRHRRPNLLALHIGETDYAGHSAGWMSFFYGLAARRADAAIGEILEAADDSYGRGTTPSSSRRTTAATVAPTAATSRPT
jgi:predicted AlkP superfamily pyrophosphatase or phosphodiesterase